MVRRIFGRSRAGLIQMVNGFTEATCDLGREVNEIGVHEKGGVDRYLRLWCLRLIAVLIWSLPLSTAIYTVEIAE